jgi:hypothetical protein
MKIKKISHEAWSKPHVQWKSHEDQVKIDETGAWPNFKNGLKIAFHPLGFGFFGKCNIELWKLMWDKASLMEPFHLLSSMFF